MANSQLLKSAIYGPAYAMALCLLLPVSVHAEESISSWHDDPLRLNVKFERQYSSNYLTNASGVQQTGWMSEFDNITISPNSTKYALSDDTDDNTILSQYDATFYYPFQRGKFNFDLGVNIKFINGMQETTDKLGFVSTQSFNATLPMMYATALYELPWKGVSAGFEGKHLVFDGSSTAYDYKAMLTYQNRNGFGLNGGWQYQQLHLNAFQNITADSQSEGPFVDLYFKF